MGRAPPPPLGFAPQGSKKCHFWHFLGGPLEGAPEGPVRAPNPEDPAQGGSGGLGPTTPLPEALRWTAEPWRLPRRATQGALRAEAHFGPRETGVGAPGPGGAERRPGTGGAPGLPRGPNVVRRHQGELVRPPSLAGRTLQGPVPVPFQRPDRGPAAPLPWGGPGGTVPPGAAGMKPGVWGCPPYRVPTPMDDAGTPGRGPCPSAGPRPPIQGSGGTPDPDPIRGSGPRCQGDPPEGGPGGPRGAPPRGGKISGPRGPPGKVSGNSGPAPKRAPGPGPPKRHFWGLYIARIGPYGGSGGGTPRTTFPGPPSGGSGKSGSFVGHLITLPVGTDQPSGIFGTAGTAGPGTAQRAGPGGLSGSTGRVIKRVIGTYGPGAGGSGPASGHDARTRSRPRGPGHIKWLSRIPKRGRSAPPAGPA